MSILSNLYILGAISGTTFLWALWYVSKYDRFRKVHNLKLYLYPCIYLFIATYLGLNVFSILEQYNWLWIIILYPFFFFESIAVAERSFRLKIYQKKLSTYIIDKDKKYQEYVDKKVKEYETKFEKEKINIGSWSRNKIFKKGYKRFEKK